MTDERAALIERLERRANYIRAFPTATDHAAACPGLLECAAAEIARLSEEARYERARADKAVAQLKATKADFRDFSDTRELMVRDYCALVDALGVDMDAPPAVLDAVRRHGLSLSALNAAREEARSLREAMKQLETLAWLSLQVPENVSAQHLHNVTRAALARAARTEWLTTRGVQRRDTDA